MIENRQLNKADNWSEQTVVDSRQLLTATNYRQQKTVDSIQLEPADNGRQPKLQRASNSRQHATVGSREL